MNRKGLDVYDEIIQLCMHHIAQDTGPVVKKMQVTLSTLCLPDLVIPCGLSTRYIECLLSSEYIFMLMQNVSIQVCFVGGDWSSALDICIKRVEITNHHMNVRKSYLHICHFVGKNILCSNF